MKREFVTFLFIVLLSNCCVFAQNRVVSGSVIGEEGETIEYVSIGVIGKEIGTLSDADGNFKIELPLNISDTLLFSHVSFEEKKVAVAVLLNEDAIVQMHAKELHEAIVYSGKKKNSKLVGKGMLVAGARTMWTPDNLGCEIGSLVDTDNPFVVEELSFSVMSNGIENLRLSVNIYALDEEETLFKNIIHSPVYVDIPVCDKKQKITVRPTTQIHLPPGHYYVAVKFIDCDNETKTLWSKSGEWEKEEWYRMSKQSLFFPLYLKRSFTRKSITDEPQKVPVNIGLQIKGIAYCE